MADSPTRALGEKTLGRPRAWGAYLGVPNRISAGLPTSRRQDAAQHDVCCVPLSSLATRLARWRVFRGDAVFWVLAISMICKGV